MELLPECDDTVNHFTSFPDCISENAVSCLTLVMCIYYIKFFYLNEGLIATLAPEVLLLAWTESLDHPK
jgi:hypothetical protein